MPFLETKNLTKQFGGITAVQDLEMRIDDGEIVGLIGPNGAERQRSSI
jgi:ABC-type branched-subunit amino acid transport system ATPase component